MSPSACFQQLTAVAHNPTFLGLGAHPSFSYGRVAMKALISLITSDSLERNT
jgi:hypothetical protein